MKAEDVKKKKSGEIFQNRMKLKEKNKQYFKRRKDSKILLCKKLIQNSWSNKKEKELKVSEPERKNCKNSQI